MFTHKKNKIVLYVTEDSCLDILLYNQTQRKYMEKDVVALEIDSNNWNLLQSKKVMHGGHVFT